MASVRYLVHDVDQAVAFYTGLGFTLRQQFGPAMAILARDDLTLWLAGPRASAAKPMPDGRQPEPGGQVGGPEREQVGGQRLGPGGHGRNGRAVPECGVRSAECGMKTRAASGSGLRVCVLLCVIPGVTMWV